MDQEKATLPILPPQRWAGVCAPMKRPKEIACFSYNSAHEYRPDASGLRYYYPPRLGADLCKGFETFEKLDDTPDDHLDSLLKTIMEVERERGEKVDVDVVTWRGMMTKLLASPFSDRDGFEMNATFYQIHRRKPRLQSAIPSATERSPNSPRPAKSRHDVLLGCVPLPTHLRLEIYTLEEYAYLHPYQDTNSKPSASSPTPGTPRPANTSKGAKNKSSTTPRNTVPWCKPASVTPRSSSAAR
ncbi:hypothetical protein V500_10185 [Pseudogymnoascus sp. VKM F-4518 (FW-2643)]|nr:hypothetical protein V500_10185 [Pseudogymnoascus sp. VKM F-4518 (FW-2643)]